MQDANAILEAWNQQQTKEFQIRPCDLRWNLTQQKLMRYQPLQIANTRVLLGRATKEGAALGIPDNHLHVSLWETIRDCDTFLEHLENYAREFGIQKLLFGADEFHFLPGIPAHQTDLIDSVVKHNYTTSEVADLTGTSAQSELQEFINSISTADYEFFEVRNQLEKTRMIEFLKTEFPGRWLREFLIWDQREDTQRALWFSLKKDRKSVGFARIGLRKNVLPVDQGWTMGSLRLPSETENGFSENDGCLGPIGVGKSERGKGSGKVLLGLALRELRSRSAKRICIDWTDAFKYYQRLNFKRVRNYRSAWKLL